MSKAIGVMGAMALGLAPQAAGAQPPRTAPPALDQAMAAETYADLLRPIPNATALLAQARAADAARIIPAQLVVVPEHHHHHDHDHHHHHHHDHVRRVLPPPFPPVVVRRHEHHHHDHHHHHDQDYDRPHHHDWL